VAAARVAARYNIQIEIVMFQRFGRARTALASGDIQLTASVRRISLSQ